jgi:myo-inositol 2-dehydrogenase / D-chiro-inositol 1-dehydrogenase
VTAGSGPPVTAGSGPPLRAVSSRSISVGVLGAGRIGRLHAEVIARRTPGARVGAVYDVHRPFAVAVGEELGIPVADSIEEVLDGDVDAVAVCSSSDTHVELMVAAAEAGKAIFCEKPVSLDLDELDRGLAAVQSHGVPFQVGFNRRFDPAHAAVRDAVASGRIGDPYLVRISSRDPEPPPLAYVRTSGGLFLDMTIHDFDMARFVTGSEVVEVFARGSARLRPDFAEAGDIDTALVSLVHANGCLTAIDNVRQTSYGYDQRVEAFGPGGMAASENPPAHSGVVTTADGTMRPALPHFFLERYMASYEREWEAFVSALRDGTPPPVTGQDGRAPLVIGLAAWQSLRGGRPVRLEEVAAA